MFIKVTKNPAGQSYYHLVETYRDKGKVRQRMLLSLGRVEDDRLEELVAAISRHKEIFSLLQLAKQVSVDETFILGPLLVLQRMFEKSGIDDVLQSIAEQHPKLGFDVRALVFTMVAARFVRPGSKLKVYEQWQRRFYPKMVVKDIGLHQLYRVLDVLFAHKDEIEKALFWHDRDLLSQTVDVVLYDLTTLRFESTRTDLGALRQFGYSKERRSDCTQVVLGLLVTPEGLPIGFEVYPGNTFEGSTIVDIVEDALRDGFFGVVTNVVDQSAAKIIENYKTLWIVEDAFGEVKGTLRSRPVFHWKDERIVGHLVLCFLAYLCEALMTKALRDKGLLLESPAIDDESIAPRALTVVEAMRELHEVRAIPLCVRSSTMWVRTDISGNAQKLFAAIGLKPPAKLLSLEKDGNVVALTSAMPATN